MERPQNRLAAKPPVLTRPSIGLALGGGVARGWAHIGAVQRLEELGLAPNIVCGTSVGALVGGVWLAGKLPELEAWTRSLTKRRMLSYVDLAMNGSGLMMGQRLRRVLTTHISEARIEDLPAAFVAVTAEMSTGHEVWIQRGLLTEAIEAAYALPGVFPPRAVNGRWVVDGALVNPLPVSVCRALGARMVVAVGLHADAFGRSVAARRDRYDASEGLDADDLSATKGGIVERQLIGRLFKPSGTTPGLGSVMLASFNIVMDRITRSRLAGDPPDVLISPKVGHLSLVDFDKADELIRLGREAVDEQASAIEHALSMLA